MLVVDEFFQLFSDLEEGKLFGGHADLGTGFGIAPGIGFVAIDREAAKSPDFHTPAIAKGVFNRLEKNVYDPFCFLTAEIAIFLKGHHQV